MHTPSILSASFGGTRTLWRRGFRLKFYDPNLENVYKAYSAEKNGSLTFRLHTLLILGWCVGVLNTLMRLSKSQDIDTLPIKAFLAVQCTCLATHMSLRKSLWSASHQQQQQLERTKSWVHLLLTVASMIVSLFSTDNIPSSFSIIVTTWLAVVDLLRLQTLLELHVIKCVCFILLQLDKLVLPFFLMTSSDDTYNSNGSSSKSLWGDLQAAFLFGTLLPFIVAALLEGRQRSEFLTDIGQPQSLMPSMLQNFRSLRGGGVASSSTIAGARQHID